MILSLIAPGLALARQLREWISIRENAKTEQERIAADKQVRILQAEASVRVASAEYDPWYGPMNLMGYSCALYVAKLIVWDTVLGLGVTVDPGPTVNGIVLTIIGFYTGHKGIKMIGATLLRRALL